MDSPTEVRRLKDERAVQITWASGHVSRYTYAHLRGFCPCAPCQGHGAGPKKFIPSPPDLGLDEIRTVGHYALQLVWSDKHATGIYSFEYLRGLCPCCAGAPGGAIGPST